MARNASDYDNARFIWRDTKVHCPICNTLISNWYCPNCGLPKNNSKYGTYKEVIYGCGPAHFIRDTKLEEYKLCYKCYTPNPYNANFCRNCGENISSQARDKDGHGWVDLGLSVLWSTETMRGNFMWNDKNDSHWWNDEDRSRFRKEYMESNYGEIGGKDAATHHWGEKWRTPTKEEFEELITKCNWEKCLTSDSKSYALKATGPNGNSIIIPVEQDLGGEHFDQHRLHIGFWTSTSLQEPIRKAYSFRFYQKIERIITLTAKQKKAAEFREYNNYRFKYQSRSNTYRTIYLSEVWGYGAKNDDINRGWKEKEKEIEKKIREYENAIEQQRKILEAMGDDSQEIRDIAKKEKDRVDNLWLTTPIQMHPYTNEDVPENTPHIVPRPKVIPLMILPVTDKK